MSYTIDGISLNDYGLTITKSEGLLDVPPRAGKTFHNWDGPEGIEPYISASDLNWSGRSLKLHAFYHGSDYLTDISNLLSTHGGKSITLQTLITSHTCQIEKIKTGNIIKANKSLYLTIELWEKDVPHTSPPGAIGGTGDRLSSYDFEKDLDLYINKASGFYDHDYNKKAKTYGVLPPEIGPYHRIPQIIIPLNGVFSSPSVMVTKMQLLKNILMSPGEKSLIYRGKTFDTFFDKGVSINYNRRQNAVSFNLILNRL